MAESTINAERGKPDQEASQLVNKMRNSLRTASSLMKAMEHGDASVEYARASDMALKLSEHYDGTTGPYGVGVSSRYQTLARGYRNMAGVYAGWADDAKRIGNVEKPSA